MTIDTLQVEIKAITSDFNRQIDGVKGKINELGNAGDQSSKQLFAGFDGVGKAGATALKVGIVGAIAAIGASIPGAVRRIDTLNNAPKIFANLGYAAGDSEKAMNKLDMGIRGLPTSLDGATSSLVAIASASGKGISEATDLTLAFNNMALAGGKGPAEAQRAFVQFTQAVGRGKMGMQEFNTLSEVMPAQLTQVAQSLIGPSANMATLRDALSDGTVTMDQFMNEIVRLDKEGGTGFASFSQQAKDATAGIATGFANMMIGITRGVAAILAAIGSANIAEAMGAIGRAFGAALLAVAALIEFVVAHSEIFAPIAVGIGAVVAVLTAWHIITKAMTAAQAVFNAVLLANPIGLVILAVAGLVAGLVYLWNTSTGFRNFFVNMWGQFVSAIQPLVAAFNQHLLPVLMQVWSFVAGQLKQAWDNLRAAFNSVRAALEPLIARSSAFIPVLKAVGVAVAVAVIAPLALMVGAIVAVIAIIAVVVSSIANFISYLVRLYAKLVEVSSLATGTVVNAFSSAWNRISSIWSAASGFFSGVVGSIRGAVSGIPSTFGSIFQSAYGRITSIFSGLASWFSSINLSGAGRAMISSLIGGIQSMVGAAKSAVSSVVSSIRDFFPFSPAKEGPFSGSGYTTHSGKALMQDFAGAIKKQSPYLQKTMDNAIPSLTVPTYGQLDAGFSSRVSPSMNDMSGRQTPIVVQLDGDTLLSFVVDGINGKAFMTNRTELNI